MSNTLDLFLEILRRHAQEKCEFYDGMASVVQRPGREVPSVVYALTLATEELGEIASALIRGRERLAEFEAVDLAHCAFLIWALLRDGEA